jgi:hypothetical protein
LLATAAAADAAHRICNVQDPLVDVVYVSAVPLPAEVLAYYYRLLELGGVRGAETRVRIVWPEHTDRCARAGELVWP